MRILLIGSGGREHAIAWKLRQSPLLNELFIAPGNAGTAQVGTNVDLDAADQDAVVRFCESEKIDMVVVGPEIPLVAGLCDHLSAKLPSLKLVGPGAAGAQLEGSKAFSKEFMAEFDIPTAGYKTFTADDVDAAKAFLRKLEPPYVLKADGLAAGKGVVIPQTLEEAEAELDEMLGGKFGEASAKVVIEEFLTGPEFSVFVLTNGEDYQLLPVARDYKRVGEGDTGPNTGGMGAVSPVPFVDKYMMAKVRERIVEPTLDGLRDRKIPYTGIIFIGLINVEDEPYVIEYNCRLGDPETEVIMPRITSDLVQLFSSLFDGTLADNEVSVDSRSAATVVMASGGYPGSYEKGKVITGLDEVKSSIPFLAGVTDKDGELVTNGGRVLMLTSYGLTYMEAAEMSRRAAAKVTFDGGFFRKDIGK
ncbi:MAG: phosphoribosylamine--glycine ligase [Saprospiraceae bacterium]